MPKTKGPPKTTQSKSSARFAASLINLPINLSPVASVIPIYLKAICKIRLFYILYLYLLFRIYENTNFIIIISLCPPPVKQKYIEYFFCLTLRECPEWKAISSSHWVLLCLSLKGQLKAKKNTCRSRCFCLNCHILYIIYYPLLTSLWPRTQPA